MEAGQARIDRIEPPQAEAAPEPDLAVRGTKSIREVMVATEVEVASMLARVDADVARLIADADANARARVIDRREQLAGVRRELAIWAAAVAVGFENLLGLLDEADSRLAAPEPPRAVPEPPQARQVPPLAAVPKASEQPRLRLAESPAPAPEGSPSASGGETDAQETEDTSRRRWWMRWFRPAA